MGPPTPTLHSAPVDENDPEYIRRAEGRRILANSFEAIFAKYGNMREEESDEIDFSKGVAGTIALDRGHLREMKEPKGPGQLLDTFFDHDENALAACGDSEDDIDELASPEPPSRRKDRKQDYRGEVRVQVDEQPVAPVANEPTIAPPQTPSSLTLAGVPTAASPFAMQLSQSPQVSLNPDLQNIIQNAIALGVSQALQASSAVLSALGIAPNNPPFEISTGLTPATPAAATALAPESTLTPGTNPNWYFPELPDGARPSYFKLNPKVASMSGRKRKSFSKPTCDRPVKRLLLNKQIIASPARNSTEVTTEEVPSQEGRDMTVEHHIPSAIGRDETSRSRGTRKYHFSPEDDEYIIMQRGVRKLSWKAIKAGRPAWKNWPMQALHYRYKSHLKNRLKKGIEDKHASTRKKNQETEDAAWRLEKVSIESGNSAEASVTPGEPANLENLMEVSDSHAQMYSPRIKSRQLPTPPESLREQQEAPDDLFYDHETDPVSFPETGGELAQSSVEGGDTDEFDAIQDYEPVGVSVLPDDIIPSIETDTYIMKGEERRAMLDVEFRIPTTPLPTNATAESGPVSEKSRKIQHQPPTGQVDRDSDDDIDLVDSEQPSLQVSKNQVFSIPSQNFKHPEHLPAYRSPTYGVDELTAFDTSQIKQEQVSPKIFSIPLKTPKPVTPRTKRESIGSKSTPRAKNRYLNGIKNSWNKKKYTPASIQKMERQAKELRKMWSLGDVREKRRNSLRGEDSGDELA